MLQLLYLILQFSNILGGVWIIKLAFNFTLFFLVQKTRTLTTAIAPIYEPEKVKLKANASFCTYKIYVLHKNVSNLGGKKHNFTHLFTTHTHTYILNITSPCSDWKAGQTETLLCWKRAGFWPFPSKKITETAINNCLKYQNYHCQYTWISWLKQLSYASHKWCTK